MTLKLSDRDLETLLREPNRDTRPPHDLLARLRADLPTEIPTLVATEFPAKEPEVPAQRLPKPLPFLRRPIFALAASLGILALGTVLAYRTFRAVPAPLAESQAKEVGNASPSAVPSPAEPQASLSAQGTLKEKKAAPPPPPPRGEISKEEAAPARLPRRIAVEESSNQAPELEKSVTLADQKDEAPKVDQTGQADRDPKVDKAVETGAAAGETSGVIHSVIQSAETPLPRLESPTIEGNSTVDLRSTAAQEGAERLEDPAVQGDVGRRAARDAARPAPAAKVAEPGAGYKFGDAEKRMAEPWQEIERALAGGRWPTPEEIAAARPPLELGKVAGKPGLSRQSDTGKVAKLQDDALSFFGQKEKSRAELYILRRRATKLVERQPQDAHAAALLRALNLAEKVLPQ